jgi:hypothetical protein
MQDHTTPICPLPGLGHCVRERCNFWDEDKEVCTADCFDATDPHTAAGFNPDGDCIIGCYEDLD